MVRLRQLKTIRFCDSFVKVHPTEPELYLNVESGRLVTLANVIKQAAGKATSNIDSERPLLIEYLKTEG